jgi:hypothetical protein
VPAHCRMRAFDWDLIRGGHYGQRSCEPRLIGRTHGCTDQCCNAKKALANSEPSTHGTERRLRRRAQVERKRRKADIERPSPRWRRHATVPRLLGLRSGLRRSRAAALVGNYALA